MKTVESTAVLLILALVQKLTPLAQPALMGCALQELLTAALSHSEAFGQATSSARALLALAQLEQLVNQPQAAMQLVQQAHKARGDTATCCKAVQLYAELSGQLGKPADAVTALQSGIDMMDRLVRSVRPPTRCRSWQESLHNFFHLHGMVCLCCGQSSTLECLSCNDEGACHVGHGSCCQELYTGYGLHARI